MDFDVCIVGAGPAGLSAAITLKQVAPTIKKTSDHSTFKHLAHFLPDFAGVSGQRQGPKRVCCGEGR